MRTLIKGGMVYDGSGCQGRKLDLVVEDERISDIQPQISGEFDRVICADGKTVTPGFIDSHRHGDMAVLRDPFFGELELAQGITTLINGNCGMSLFPCSRRYAPGMYSFLEPCLGKIPEELLLENYPAYLAELKKVPLRLNVGCMIGTGAVRIGIRGFQKGRMDAKEKKLAERKIREALDAGAVGVSAGIMYMPECENMAEDYTDILNGGMCGKGIFTAHIRGEGTGLLSAVREILEIGRNTGIPANISHFKCVGTKNWGSGIKCAVEEIEKNRGEVTVDFYPYTGGATTLMTLLPNEIQGNTPEETLTFLSTSKGRNALRESLSRPQPGWDNMVEAIGYERILVGSVTRKEDERYTGKSISELAKGYEAEFLADLLVKEEGKVGAILMSMCQEDVDTVAQLPYSMVISDSLYGDMEHPHPRLYGSFPKIICDYVKNRKILSMETAIHKMTGMTAKRFGIAERGLLKVGYYADILIFDENSFRDQADYMDSARIATGMELVFVNGEIAFDHGKAVSFPGKQIIKER